MKEVLRALSNDIEYAGELSELTAQEANEVNRLVTLCAPSHIGGAERTSIGPDVL